MSQSQIDLWSLILTIAIPVGLPATWYFVRHAIKLIRTTQKALRLILLLRIRDEYFFIESNNSLQLDSVTFEELFRHYKAMGGNGIGATMHERGVNTRLDRIKEDAKEWRGGN